MRSTTPIPTISVVVPLLDEEENVEELYRQVRDVLGSDSSWELILVDDGSRDATFQRAEELPRHDGAHLRLIKLRSNAGQTPAMVCGIDHARGRIRVHKVWAAIDGGIIVQPDMARANVESGIVYGLSSVLKERATIKDGAVEQSNFHDYEVLRMSEAPEEIHVTFLDRDTKPTGLGEIGNPFIAAAVANAFFALTGKRLYHMPFTPDRVLEVLKA